MLRSCCPPAAKGARVYFEVDRTPYAAGEASFIGQTLGKLGLKNIVGKELGAFPKINPEFVVQQQPDVIVLSERHAAELPKRPGWGQLKALQNKAVCELTAQEGDVVVRSGPRLAEGAKVIASNAWRKRCCDEAAEKAHGARRLAAGHGCAAGAAGAASGQRWL
ncbi:MAG: ABC transporter substrate-binding protein [Brachymonas sp.]|nr:ABC transporter substrate-binding protein [Brachymonas sp.]